MKIFFSILLLLLFYPRQTLGQHNFGAGIVLGDPTGITIKYNFDKSSALDGALSFRRGNYFHLHSTWLWNKARLFAIDKYPVNWYFGVGPRLINHDHDHHHHHRSFGHKHDDDHDNDLHLAARVPFGLRMNFTNPRIEIFSELSFALDVIPQTDFDLGLALGGRYYF